MTLENLSSIGKLKPHKATRREIQRLLAAAEDALADSGRTQNSAATRFDAAYKSLMQCALAALMASGYAARVPEMLVEFRGVRKYGKGATGYYAIRLGRILRIKRWRGCSAANDVAA